MKKVLFITLCMLTLGIMTQGQTGINPIIESPNTASTTSSIARSTIIQRFNNGEYVHTESFKSSGESENFFNYSYNAANYEDKIFIINYTSVLTAEKEIIQQTSNHTIAATTLHNRGFIKCDTIIPNTADEETAYKSLYFTPIGVERVIKSYEWENNENTTNINKKIDKAIASGKHSAWSVAKP